MTTVVVDQQVSIVGPGQPMLGPIPSGSRVIIRTAPGCWGPMITPGIVGGHEVSQPIAIENAEPGDALAIKILGIDVLSSAAMSGVDRHIKERFSSDPGIDAKCENCGRKNPETVIVGTGADAVRCAACGSSASPYACVNGYTMVFDDDRAMGITVGPGLADEIAKRPYHHAAMPESARQHPSTVLAAADLVGVWSRLRPFIGNIGTSPAITIPAAKNSTDLTLRMVGATHPYCLGKSEALKSTDAHLDCDQVRTGAILIAPVAIPYAGFYMGDVHAVQGDGEIAGHTVDVSAEVTVEVHLLKALNLEGPVLLPPVEDLPHIARPLTPDEAERVRLLSERVGTAMEHGCLPIQVIGAGIGLNAAVENALARMSRLTGIDIDEVRNRTTITGGVEIARLSGIVQLTMLVPLSVLDRCGIGEIVREAYS